MQKTFVPLFLSVCLTLGCGPNELAQDYPEAFTVEAENTLSLNRPDASIRIGLREIRDAAPDFNPKAFVTFAGGLEIPSQSVDADADGDPEAIVLNADFAASEGKTFTIRYAPNGEKRRDYVQRAHAELSIKTGGEFVDRVYQGGDFQDVNFLSVPKEHTDHSLYIRYEGPGWESDKVGYRFYLDWRNATDIFGKKIPDMVLPHVGLDGFESYHEMSDWGMDILKVGESLGIGSPGIWLGDHAQRIAETDSVTSRILEDGPVFARIRTRYFGWQAGSAKTDVISDLSITAGSRMTCQDLRLTKNLPNLCTGIVKHEKAGLIESNPDSGWAYLAIYGPQSLNDDDLGMAVLYRTRDLIRITEDAHSHVVVLRPEGGSLTYYFLAAWAQEPGGIRSEESFVRYLEDTVRKLNKPIQIQIRSPQS